MVRQQSWYHITNNEHEIKGELSIQVSYNEESLKHLRTVKIN